MATFEAANAHTVVKHFGGLAQLARAPALHAGGHRFDSDILHQKQREYESESRRNARFLNMKKG